MNKFPVDSANCSLLSIEQRPTLPRVLRQLLPYRATAWHSQLKVKDVVRLDIQLVGDGLHEQRVVLARESGRYGTFRGFALFRVFLLGNFRVDCRGIELLVDESKNGLKETCVREVKLPRSSRKEFTWNSVSLLNLKASLIVRSR